MAFRLIRRCASTDTRNQSLYVNNFLLIQDMLEFTDTDYKKYRTLIHVGFSILPGNSNEMANVLIFPYLFTGCLTF